MKYKCVIFDLDGTLLNTLDDIKDSLNAALENFGQSGKSEEEVRRAVGNGSRRLVELSLAGRENDPVFQNVFDFYKSYYPEHCNIKTRPYEGVSELLHGLKNKGVKTAIVSNKPQEAVSSLSADLFGELIELALGESPMLPRKPDPAMLIKAARELGCKKEDCVYIGDSETDIQTAKNAGIKIITVLWGFRTKEELMKSGAETLAAEVGELADFLGL